MSQATPSPWATPCHLGAAALPAGPSVCALQPCGAEPWGQGRDSGTGGRAGRCTADTVMLRQYSNSAGAPCCDQHGAVRHPLKSRTSKCSTAAPKEPFSSRKMESLSQIWVYLSAVAGDQLPLAPAPGPYGTTQQKRRDSHPDVTKI